jgi:hypothetical protein
LHDLSRLKAGEMPGMGKAAVDEGFFHPPRRNEAERRVEIVSKRSLGKGKMNVNEQLVNRRRGGYRSG